MQSEATALEIAFLKETTSATKYTFFRHGQRYKVTRMAVPLDARASYFGTVCLRCDKKHRGAALVHPLWVGEVLSICPSDFDFGCLELDKLGRWNLEID